MRGGASADELMPADVSGRPIEGRAESAYALPLSHIYINQPLFDAFALSLRLGSSIPESALRTDLALCPRTCTAAVVAAEVLLSGRVVVFRLRIESRSADLGLPAEVDRAFGVGGGLLGSIARTSVVLLDPQPIFYTQTHADERNIFTSTTLKTASWLLRRAVRGSARIAGACCGCC